MKYYENIIRAIYQKYNPEKLENIGNLLQKYSGQEEELIDSLITKYQINDRERDDLFHSEGSKPIISELEEDKIIVENKTSSTQPIGIKTEENQTNSSPKKSSKKRLYVIVGVVLLIIIVIVVVATSNSGSVATSSSSLDSTAVSDSGATQSQAKSSETEQPTKVSKTNVSARQPIDLYYEELRSENFDANRYFSPQIERFISMKNTTPEAINKYIINSYFKGYKNNDYSIENGSYEERSLDNGNTEASFIEVGTCFKVKQDKDLFTRLKMVVLVNSEGKIYKWTQTAVLEKR